MTDKNSVLKQINLRNFLSLHEVSLPFKPLTVLSYRKINFALHRKINFALHRKINFALQAIAK